MAEATASRLVWGVMGTNSPVAPDAAGDFWVAGFRSGLVPSRWPETQKLVIDEPRSPAFALLKSPPEPLAEGLAPSISQIPHWPSARRAKTARPWAIHSAPTIGFRAVD